MGGTSYSFSDRTIRAASAGYHTKSADQIFEQNAKRMIHESMEPKKAILRESRDSEVHPNSVPIILALDVTGSMGKIPHYLVKDGLPNMMANIIQRGVLDPQILFLPVGDHECDRYPLQVGQFESGDAELDLWLTRTYIESGGGGNSGESYLLAWYFGANHTVTDSWEKRKQKGFIFTVGDEPCLRNLPNTVINEIMGVKPQASFTEKDLLVKAQEQYNVYHLHIMEGSDGARSLSYWKELLGDHCIQVNHHQDVAKVLADIVVENVDKSIINTTSPVIITPITPDGDGKILL
jgi:hypothetical protein